MPVLPSKTAASEIDKRAPHHVDDADAASIAHRGVHRSAEVHKNVSEGSSCISMTGTVVLIVPGKWSRYPISVENRSGFGRAFGRVMIRRCGAQRHGEDRIGGPLSPSTMDTSISRGRVADRYR